MDKTTIIVVDDSPFASKQIKDLVEERRADLIDTVVEFDEAIMEKYLEGEEPTVEEIKACIRKGTLAAEFFPVMCGSAYSTNWYSIYKRNWYGRRRNR